MDFPDEWKLVEEWYKHCSGGNTRSRLTYTAMEQILPALIHHIDTDRLKPFTRMYSLAFQIRDTEYVVNVDAEVQDFKTYCVALYHERSSRPLQQYEHLTADEVLPTINALAAL